MALSRQLFCMAACVALVVAGAAAQSQLVLSDPLNGSTSGTREGGAFVTGGWQVVNQYDCIYWHVPTLTRGAFEYDVRGLGNTCSGGLGEKNELSHMYDYTFGNADVNYNGGYRDGPYKQFIRKQCYSPKERTLELLWKIGDNHFEDDSGALAWDANATYRFRNVWEPVGGNTVLRTYRNGVLIHTQSLPGAWNPGGFSVRIGASPRRADEGAPVGAVFSNVKVWDGPPPDGVPNPPVFTVPASGATVNITTVFARWNADAHSQYQVRINTANNPETGIVWDSLAVASPENFAWSGVLNDQTTYYLFGRIANSGGWSGWSAAGYSFVVNTAYVPPAPNIVRIDGDAAVNHGGPFLGLGATYMQAMRRCKYDRNRFISDLGFLASRDIKYIRILSMVGWYSYWQGFEIAPVSFNNEKGVAVAAWPDYWQQLRDCVDIAYDHGLLTELTIFADAQLMPNKTTRINHMNLILQNLAGREHKIMHLEVANEAWQNGFPGTQGEADLKEFAQYLKDRTSLLVAITSPPDTTNNGISALYCGTAADLATVHLSRDTGTVEGGWLPVRDCWRVGDIACLQPVSSNEPIGPGSSVSTENDPIKLVSAAAFAWMAGLPMYVFHSGAGVRGDLPFQNMAGINDFVHLDDLLPPDLAGWVRHDGKDTVAPFISYANGQPNKWWTEVGSPTSGVLRHPGKIKGADFITLPIAIRSGGVELEARRQIAFQVYHPLTGTLVTSMSKNPGERFNLAQGPQAYIIKGTFTDVVSGNGVWIDLGSTDAAGGMSHPQNADGDTTPATIAGRDARRNINPSEDYYFYFGVNDAFAYQGSKPSLYITVGYFDGAGSLSLQYDAAGSLPSSYYKSAGTIAMTGSNTWREQTFHVTDAYFGNRQNAGADFRFGNIGQTFYIDTVRVSTQQPMPPVIREVTPDPQVILMGMPYVRSLSLLEGSPPPTWTILQSPAAARISTSGFISGWTPGAPEFGFHMFEVEAANSEGADTEDWQVLVVSRCDFDEDGDVDQADFGDFQLCHAGDGKFHPVGCEAADFDGDGDVDYLDFAVFQACTGGANSPPLCTY